MSNKPVESVKGKYACIHQNIFEKAPDGIHYENTYEEAVAYIKGVPTINDVVWYIAHVNTEFRREWQEIK